VTGHRYGLDQHRPSLRVKCAGSTSSRRSRHVCFASDSDQIGASQRSAAKCQSRLNALQQTAPYSITSSARAISVGGMVKPIKEAVFRLMIDSNSVASCTGKSAGLAPFRILST
jgi:hypothetical protein